MLLYDVIHYSSPAYCLSSTQSQNEATNNLQRLWMDSELSKISGNQLLKGCAMLSSFGKAQNSKPLKKFCSPQECDRTLLKSCNGRNVLIFVRCHFALWWWWTFSYIHFQQNICNTMYNSIINYTWSYSFSFYLCFPRRQTQDNVNGQFLLENSIKYENIVKSWCFAAAVYSQKLFLSSKYLNWIPWFPFLQVCQFAISRSHSSSVRKRFSWGKPPPNICGLSFHPLTYPTTVIL